MAKMDEELSKLTATRTLIEKTAAECRSVMSDLTPALLYDLGLIPALRDLADKIYEQHNVHIHVDEGGEDIPMNAPLRGLLKDGAENGARTRDIRHHKPTLYQLSYFRHQKNRTNTTTFGDSRASENY